MNTLEALLSDLRMMSDMAMSEPARRWLDAAIFRAESPETLPNSCPDCGAGIVIGQAIAVCEANKYSSRGGAGDCRWTLALTPDLRRQADEALAAQKVAA